MATKDPIPGVRVDLRKELLGAGYDDRAIGRALRAGNLARVRYGAYVDGPTWAGLDDAGRHRLAVRAAVRQSRTEVVASHTSAVVEHGGPTWGLPIGAAHLTRLDRRAGRAASGIVQHRGHVRPDDVVEHAGLAVTAPAVTALDVIATSPTEVGLVVTNYFLHHRLASRAELESVRMLHEHRPGTLAADLVLRLADERVESVGESRCFYAFWQAGLPAPQLQWEVHDGGRVVARLDFAWPEHGVFAEFDGQVKYGRLLRPGQTVSDVVDAEKRREELVCRLTGWRCLRITWEDLADPQRLAARVLGLAAHHRAA